MARTGLLQDRARSLVDLAQEEILRRIYSGELEHGQRLVIDTLAKEFGTSLIPVREALARLNAERLVTFEANRGYRVSPPPDDAELYQLFSARLILEIGALEISTNHLDATDLAEMKRMNEAMRKCSIGTGYQDFSSFVQLNSDFHERIVNASGNSFIIETFQGLAYRQRISQSLEGRGVPDLETLVEDHQRIIDALESRDIIAAREALRSHIIESAVRMGVRMS